jgi:hypothetical protein
MCYNKDTVRERKISNRKEYIKMVELNQKQLKELAKTLSATDLTKCKSADQVTEKLDLVACSCGQYGLNAKLWRGRETAKFYFATNYSANLYRF